MLTEEDINQEEQRVPQQAPLEQLSLPGEITIEGDHASIELPTSTTEELLGLPSNDFVQNLQSQMEGVDYNIAVPPVHIEIHPANIPLDPMADTQLVSDGLPTDIRSLEDIQRQAEQDYQEIGADYEDDWGDEEEEVLPAPTEIVQDDSEGLTEEPEEERYVDARFSRFKGAEWFIYMGSEVLIGGAGGIGSWLAMLLARASFSINIFDFDVVEEHNIGGQLFGNRQIGRSKVMALSDNIIQLCAEYINGYSEAYTDKSMTNNYTFSAFDNMKARKDMFKVWKDNWANDENAVFIDGRLTFEQIQIFCIKGGDAANIAKYEAEHLFDDSAVQDAPCTMKQTSHSAAMIAAMMVGLFTNYLSRKAGKPCATPFFTEYFMPLCILNKEM